MHQEESGYVIANSQHVRVLDLLHLYWLRDFCEGSQKLYILQIDKCNSVQFWSQNLHVAYRLRKLFFHVIVSEEPVKRGQVVL